MLSVIINIVRLDAAGATCWCRRSRLTYVTRSAGGWVHVGPGQQLGAQARMHGAGDPLAHTFICWCSFRQWSATLSPITERITGYSTISCGGIAQPGMHNKQT